MSETQNPTSTVPEPRRPINALSKWEREAGVAAATVSEIRLDPNERLFVPFTTSVDEVNIHYVEYSSLKCYVPCNGADCMLCRIGRKIEKRDLWPVYDVVTKEVGVLAISENARPHALRPALIPVMRRLAGGDRLLLAIKKLDNYRFSVAMLPLQQRADDGADKIRQFIGDYDAGTIRLVAIYAPLSNEAIAVLPEVATILAAKGITL